MRKETTKRSKRISKAERQRQKLILMGGGAIIVLILIVILGIFIFGSCGTDYAEADTNTVFVLKDGKIVSTDVESFDQKKYNETEFESYVTGIVDTYNKKNGEDSLMKKSFIVEEGVATLVLEYSNGDVYEDINGVEFFTGTIKEAQKAGYTFDVNFAQMKDGKAVAADAKDFVKGEDYKVVIIKSNTKVVVPGEICFVSTQNVSKVGEDFVLIKDGSALLTEEVFDNTEETTEIEGAVGEDEVEGGDGEIIFDFGDEPDEESSQYSEVLTYIIYK